MAHCVRSQKCAVFWIDRISSADQNPIKIMKIFSFLPTVFGLEIETELVTRTNFHSTMGQWSGVDLRYSGWVGYLTCGYCSGTCTYDYLALL